uniref:Uncharacterized protein n=1 Tax=Rhizophora mucronata TaxID=61149 RepID=A0A2P2QER7_RHIMU
MLQILSFLFIYLLFCRVHQVCVCKRVTFSLASNLRSSSKKKILL